MKISTITGCLSPVEFLLVHQVCFIWEGEGREGGGVERMLSPGLKQGSSTSMISLVGAKCEVMMWSTSLRPMQ